MISLSPPSTSWARPCGQPAGFGVGVLEPPEPRASDPSESVDGGALEPMASEGGALEPMGPTGLPFSSPGPPCICGRPFVSGCGGWGGEFMPTRPPPSVTCTVMGLAVEM